MPPGEYAIMLANSGKFGPNTPSPTNNGVAGEITTPLGTPRTLLRFHEGTYSEGCITLGKVAKGVSLKHKIRDLVIKHRGIGGTIFTIREIECCEWGALELFYEP